MSAVDTLFKTLRSQHRKALMPFLTAGDPDIQTTASILHAISNGVADLVEIGVPYSDPIADGPVIQASYQRALDGGFKLQQVFDLGHTIAAAPAAPAMPRVTMVSYSIIHRLGIDKYVALAQAAGYAGAIVPDLLVEESSALAKACRSADFSLIQLVTPTTPRDRQKRIADASTGFLYYVSVTGITGERTTLPPNLVESVTWLREQTSLPLCIGFGISGVETASKLAPVADGLIVGSAVVRRIAAAGKQNAPAEVRDFLVSLRTAIDAV